MGSAADLPFMINFHFGKKKTTFKTVLVLTVIVASLSSCLKIDEKHLWDIIYEYLQTHQPDSPLLPELRKDSGIVDRDVKRTVDKAIRDYWKQTGYSPVEVYKPRYIEEANDETLCYSDECKALAPPMRLCAPWLDSCPAPVVK